MKKQVRIYGLLLLFTFFSAASCNEEKDEPTVQNDASEYIVFGDFYGFCSGDECIRIFKLSDGKLYKDSKQNYPQQGAIYSGTYGPVSSAKTDSIDMLLSGYPLQLLNDTNEVFGCPDCVDQGGMYLEIKTNSSHRSWLFDNVHSALPVYLQDYASDLRKAVDLARDK